MPVEALEISELNTPLVHTFFPPSALSEGKDLGPQLSGSLLVNPGSPQFGTEFPSFSMEQKLRTGPAITSPKRVKDERITIFLFSLEKVGEFRKGGGGGKRIV